MGVRPRPARHRPRGSAVQTCGQGEATPGAVAGGKRAEAPAGDGRQPARAGLVRIDRGSWWSASDRCGVGARAGRRAWRRRRRQAGHRCAAYRSSLISGPGRGATRLRESSVIPPGFHLEHPTAREGCRSASQGLTLTLNAGRDRTERSCRTSMPERGILRGKAVRLTCRDSAGDEPPPCPARGGTPGDRAAVADGTAAVTALTSRIHQGCHEHMIQCPAPRPRRADGPAPGSGAGRGRPPRVYRR